MPFLYLDPSLEHKSKRNVLTSGAASTYMFTSFELSDDNGIQMCIRDRPGTVPVNHVLLYAGEDADGNKLWVHCASGTGVVLNSPDYVTQYRRRNDVDLEGDLVPAALDVEEAGESG